MGGVGETEGKGMGRGKEKGGTRVRRNPSFFLEKKKEAKKNQFGVMFFVCGIYFSFGGFPAYTL